MPRLGIASFASGRLGFAERLLRAGTNLEKRTRSRIRRNDERLFGKRCDGCASVCEVQAGGAHHALRFLILTTLPDKVAAGVVQDAKVARLLSMET